MPTRQEYHDNSWPKLILVWVISLSSVCRSSAIAGFVPFFFCPWVAFFVVKIVHNIVSDSNSEAQPAASKVKVGDIRNSCTWHWCSSLSLLDLEPVVGKNPLLWNTGQVFIFPKYPFNDQPEREGERLGGLHTNCLGWDSNQGFWICSWVCYPFYNRGTCKQAKGTSHT